MALFSDYRGRAQQSTVVTCDDRLLSVHTSGKLGDSEFSRGELRACRKSWGICIARYGPVDCSILVILKPW